MFIVVVVFAGADDDVGVLGAGAGNLVATTNFVFSAMVMVVAAVAITYGVAHVCLWLCGRVGH